MVAYYEVKVRFNRLVDEGDRRVTEIYLVNALSVTEAKARVITKLYPYVSYGYIEIVNVSACKYCELLLNDEDYYYKAKVEVERINEKTGRASKSSTLSLLINAEDIESAFVICRRYIKESVETLKLTSISECPIVGVINSGIE